MAQAARGKVSEEELEYVRERIAQAVKTLRMMPRSHGGQKMTSWPEIIRTFWEIWGGEALGLPPLLRPTPRQVSEMDEVLDWLAWLAVTHGGEHARIVWAEAAGMSYRRLGRKLKCSHNTAKSRVISGLYLIALHRVKK
jgi:hypothetical protein